MALWRVTAGSGGFAEYLEHAAMAGRTMTRDEMDERIHLEGSLEEFEAVVAHTQDTKNWKSHYKHITIGMSPAEQHIIDEDPDRLREAVKRTIQHLAGPGVNLDDLTFYAEYHKPKLHSYTDANGNTKERLGHVHIGLALGSEALGKQLRVNPFNEEFDRAFQTLLCYELRLDDPADHPRDVADETSKADYIAAVKGDLTEAKSWQEETTIMRNYYSERLEGVTTLEDAIKRLENDTFTASFELKTPGVNGYKGKDAKIVATLHNGNNINLTGRGFDDLMKVVLSPERYAQKVANGSHKEGLTPTGKRAERRQREKLSREDAQRMVEERELWMYERNKADYGEEYARNEKMEAKLAERAGKEAEFVFGGKNNDAKTSHAQGIEDNIKKWTDFYESKSYEQRCYWRAFKNEIKEDLVSGFKIAGSDGDAKLLNHSRKIYIREIDDTLTSERLSVDDCRKDAVSIMIQRAQEKNLDLDKIKITGSQEFCEEVRAQIKEITSDPDYKKPDNTVAGGELQEQVDPALRADGQSKMQASAHDTMLELQSASGTDFDSDTLGNGIEITENDDSFSIAQKLASIWDTFWKKQEQTRMRLLAEEQADQQKNLKQSLKMIQSIFKHLVSFPAGIKPRSFQHRPDNQGSSTKVVGKAHKQFVSKANGFSQSVEKAAALELERQAKQDKKYDLDALKNVDAKAVIDFAANNPEIGILAKNYEVTADNKIRDIRSNAAPRTTIDFLMKTCCMKFGDAADTLTTISNDLAMQQTADQVMSQAAHAFAQDQAADLFEDQVEDAVHHNEELVEDVIEHEAKEDELEVKALRERMNDISADIREKEAAQREADRLHRIEEEERRRNITSEERFIDKLSKEELQNFTARASRNGLTPEQLVQREGLHNLERNLEKARGHQNKPQTPGHSYDLER